MNRLASRSSKASSPNAAADDCAKPLKVLHVNSGNLYGGVETILVTLARLRDLCPGMESHYALCHEGRLSHELGATGVPVYLLGHVRISRPWTVWRARRRLREVLRRNRFDMVICHMPWSLAVFGRAVRGTGQRLGFWAHGFHHGRNWLERWARWTRPDLAIANSHFTEIGLRNLFPDVSVGIVYPPVALPSNSHPEWRTRVRREQGVDDETVVIIQVSRLEPGKGHLLHLEALAQLKDSGSWVCWFVGGPQKPAERQYLQILQERTAELGLSERVCFLGQRSDVPRLLAGADIFCHPNDEPESFGIGFIEALWAGLPVITTAIGGGKEILANRYGLLAEPGKVDQVTESVRRLLEDRELRVLLGRAGASRARDLCDPATQMRTLFECVAGESRR
jgi:glycosyltransferase involved in cell wall biosynthesis